MCVCVCVQVSECVCGGERIPKRRTTAIVQSQLCNDFAVKPRTFHLCRKKIHVQMCFCHRHVSGGFEILSTAVMMARATCGGEEVRPVLLH